MGWTKLQQRHQTLNEIQNAYQTNGWIEKKVDNNNDNIFEAVQMQSKNTKETLQTKYDFDSNGATDYSEIYYNNKVISQTWYTNDPKNNEAKEPNLLDKVFTFFGKIGLDNDLKKAPEIVRKSQLEISQARQELEKEIYDQLVQQLNSPKQEPECMPNPKLER